MATLIATSDAEEAFEVADRVLLLDKTGLHAAGDASAPSRGHLTYDHRNRTLSRGAWRSDYAQPLSQLIRRWAVFALLLGLIVVFAAEEPAFQTLPNVMSVLQAVSVVAIIGVGVTISIAVGGFDLSVGAIAASSVMAASYAMVVWHFSAAETVLLVLTFGLAVGLRQR